jgi:hypothetical protein
VTEVLAILGDGAVAALAGALIWCVYKLVRSKDDQILAIKRIEQLDTQLEHTRGDLNVETAAHVATSEELRKEKLLRASAEAERNEAIRRDREQIVEHLNSVGIADAAAIGNRILSAPLPGTRLSDTPGNDLEKPDL